MADMSYNSFMQKNVGTILTALLVSFIIGTVGMIYNSDKNNEVFKAQLNFIAQRVAAIEVDIKDVQLTVNKNMGDRWTKSDHLKYREEVNNKFIRVFNRLRKVENRVLK